MSLLTTVMDHSLDDGYAEAARSRAQDGPHGLPGLPRGRLTLACGLTLAALVVTVGAVHAHQAEPALARQRDALIHRMTDAGGAVDRLQRQVGDLQHQVDQARRQALRGGDDAGAAELAASTGTAAVTGPGVRLVIDDAGDTGAGGSADTPRQMDGLHDLGRLRDRDLQAIVNGLWQSGAEAVAINGQRLTALSAIRAAGDAILVDNRPLVPPYTVLAVGDGPKLTAAFRATEAGRYLRILQDSSGIRAALSTQRTVTLPAALGVTLRDA